MKPWLRNTLIGIPLGLVVLVLGVILFRDPLASFFFRLSFEKRGMQCTHVSVHLPVAWPPLPIQLEPTRCGVTEGPKEVVEFKEPLVITAPNGKTLISCASLLVEMRPMPHTPVVMNTLGEITKLVGQDEPGIELMFSSAILSADQSPPFHAAHAVIKREGKLIVEFHDLHVVSTGPGMIVTSPSARIEQTKALGVGKLRLEATPDAATVNVVFDSINVKLDIQHIRSKTPKAAYSLGDASLKPSPPKG